MENTIRIHHTLAFAAISWALENLDKDSWQFDVYWPSDSVFFKFCKKQDATIFALKWQ